MTPRTEASLSLLRCPDEPGRLRILSALCLAALGACEKGPCRDGQRLAENLRDGAEIRYCVSRQTGLAHGLYSCRLLTGAGRVEGRFDQNTMVDVWNYYANSRLVRSERWLAGEKVSVDTIEGGTSEPLRCDKHDIVAALPAPLQLDQGWEISDDRARRRYPDSDVIWMEGAYAADAKIGRWMYRRMNGTVRIVGEFRAGLPHGPWREYDRDGRIVHRSRYRRGSLEQGPDLVKVAASVRGMVSEEPREVDRDEIRRDLEDARR
ncbi:MAG: hypothetical protein AAFP04_03725 [Myxococcota bacterium]